MFTNFINWRKEFGTDHILTFEFPEVQEVRQLYPHGYHKTDRQGRPIYIERVGLLQIDELFKATTVDRLLRYYVREYERVQKEKFPICSKNAGSWISTSLCILDMKNVPLSKAKKVYNFVKIASSVSQDYYPEMLGNMFIVNAPMLFSGAWSLVKPMIDKRTRQKIQIKGSSFQTELFQLVDPANIPTFLGGKCECPNGCLDSSPGPWNPLNLPVDITGSLIQPEQDQIIEYQQPNEIPDINNEQPKQEENEAQQEEENKKSSSEEENIEELKNVLKGMQIEGMQLQTNPQQIKQPEQVQYQEGVEFPGLTPFNTMAEEEEGENKNS